MRRDIPIARVTFLAFAGLAVVLSCRSGAHAEPGKPQGDLTWETRTERSLIPGNGAGSIRRLDSGSADGTVPTGSSVEGIAGAPLVAQWAVCGVGGSGTAEFRGLATDKAGNIYAAGLVDGDVVLGNGVTVEEAAQLSSATLVKYSPGGKVLWARTVMGKSTESLFSSVAVDAAGNAYVAGGIGFGRVEFGRGVQATGVYDGKMYGGGNMILAKYDPDGKALWARALTKSQGSSYLASVAVDSSGYIYGAGRVHLVSAGSIEFSNKAPSFKSFPTSAVAGVGTSALLVKYDASGRLLWADRAFSSNGHSEFSGVAIDDSDNVVAVGSGSGSAFDLGADVRLKSLNQMLVVKYNSMGKARWARTLFACSGYCELRKFCLDGNGGIYAAADLSYKEQSGQSDLYAAFGNEVTIRGSSTNGWSILVKYDASGQPAWAKKVADHPSDIRSVAADNAAVYVSGEMSAGPQEQCHDFGDGVVGRAQASWGTVEFVVGYALSGKARWVMMPPVNGESKATLDSLLADGEGSLIAAGELRGQQVADFGGGVTISSSTTSASPLLVKYKLRAGTESLAGVPCPSSGQEPESVVPFNPSGGIAANIPVVAGANGSPLDVQWARGAMDKGDESSFRAAAADFTGNVYAAGSLGSGKSYDFGDGIMVRGMASDSALVVKYSALGKTLWARTVVKATGRSWFSAVAADSTGNVFAMGSADKGTAAFGGDAVLDVQQPGKPVLVKYDPAGKAQWVQTFAASDVNPLNCSLAVGTTGTIYAAASDSIVKLDTSGKVSWIARAVGKRGRCSYYSLAVDASGNAYAVGYVTSSDTYSFGNGIIVAATGYRGRVVLVKYDDSGRALWARDFDSEYPGFQFVGLDGQGNIYAAGYMKGMYRYDFGSGLSVQGPFDSNARQVVVVVKYDASGKPLWERSLESENGVFEFKAAAMDGGHVYLACSVSRRGSDGYSARDRFTEFLAAYDFSGTLDWVVMPPWRLGRASIERISATRDGGLIITARFDDAGGLDLGSGVALEGGYNCLVAK